MTAKPGKTGKQKSSSAAKKRFRVSGSGDLYHEMIGGNHLLLQKSKRKKKLKSKPVALAKGDSSRMKKILSL